MVLLLGSLDDFQNELFCLSANDRFKAEYAQTLQRALLAATTLMVLVLWLSPVIQVEPYRLPDQFTCFLPVDLEPATMPTVRSISRPDTPMPGLDAIEPIDSAEPIAPIDHDISVEQIIRGWEPPLPRITFEPAAAIKPEIVRQIRPDYPEMARELGLAGTVLIDVLVGSDGRVLETVLSQSAHPLLDDAAVRAARSSVFRPARQGKQAVAVWVTLPYRFAVDE